MGFHPLNRDGDVVEREEGSVGVEAGSTGGVGDGGEGVAVERGEFFAAGVAGGGVVAAEDVGRFFVGGWWG